MKNSIRTGIGYDVHPLTAGRRLILGGVDIPFDKGLSSWSDGDVLIHAIIDALLGAAAMGDIGCHFPPDAPEYKGISSIVLLRQVRDMLSEKGWSIGNIDATILAERPRLKDFFRKIRGRLSKALGINISQVNVKAGTSERLGFVGRGEGIAAIAVALLEKAGE